MSSGQILQRTVCTLALKIKRLTWSKLHTVRKWESMFFSSVSEREHVRQSRNWEREHVLVVKRVRWNTCTDAAKECTWVKWVKERMYCMLENVREHILVVKWVRGSCFGGIRSSNMELPLQPGIARRRKYDSVTFTNMYLEASQMNRSCEAQHIVDF